jgi:hypothetical protein
MASRRCTSRPGSGWRGPGCRRSTPRAWASRRRGLGAVRAPGRGARTPRALRLWASRLPAAELEAGDAIASAAERSSRSVRALLPACALDRERPARQAAHGRPRSRQLDGVLFPPMPRRRSWSSWPKVFGGARRSAAAGGAMWPELARSDGDARPAGAGDFRRRAGCPSTTDCGYRAWTQCCFPSRTGSFVLYA